MNFCVQNTKHKQSKVQELPAQDRKVLGIRSPEQNWTSSDDLQLPEKHTTPRGPEKDLPGRQSRDFRIHKLEKIVAVREGKKNYPARQCEVRAALQKRSETRHICEFCIVLFHKGPCFEKYHSRRNSLDFLHAVLQSWAPEQYL